jgi:hypothetical protein
MKKVLYTDFNSDGRADVAVLRTTAGIGNISILLGGEKESGFELSSTFTAGNEPTGIVSEDVNGDRKPDLAVVSARSSSLQIYLNKGFVSGMFGGSTGTVSDRAPDMVYRFGLPGYGPTCLASGDINGDGLIDLVVCDAALPSVSVLFGKAGATFDPPIRLAVDREPSGVVIADLDGKGQRDLAVVHSGSTKLTVFINRTN